MMPVPFSVFAKREKRSRIKLYHRFTDRSVTGWYSSNVNERRFHMQERLEKALMNAVKMEETCYEDGFLCVSADRALITK